MTIENINCREELEHVIEYAVNSVEFYKYVGYPCHVNIVLGRAAYIMEGAYCTTYFGKNVFPYEEFAELLL